MNLFVIGNGFDRAHGLNTSYIDFRGRHGSLGVVNNYL